MAPIHKLTLQRRNNKARTKPQEAHIWAGDTSNGSPEQLWLVIYNQGANSFRSNTYTLSPKEALELADYINTHFRSAKDERSGKVEE
jgi:hypothetical protein